MAQIEVVRDVKYYTRSRLPADVIPQHYIVSLEPDVKNFTFSGVVEIKFQDSDRQINEIILNSIELDIKDGFIIDADGSKISLKKIIYNDQLEIAALSFERSIIQPKSLSLNFSGILNDRLKGFYRTKIIIDDNEIYAASTQFEASDARRAFPCFDEPAMKASFDIVIIYDAKPIIIGDKQYRPIALSNGDLTSETFLDDGRTMAKFETSPKMSTYLVAFLVGPFEYNEAQHGKCRLRTYATPDKKKYTRFALDVAGKALSFFEDFFKIKYPLNKLDLIAIPDFSLGAMENWGLITYRENCLVYDPKKSATTGKQIVATVVAHEIAHQWFGNLVTMDWWSDLWLNEGFATFMENLCPDNIFPEWDLWPQYVSNDLYDAMQLDSLRNSHPIEVTVNYSSEVDEIFDRISYEKGCSLIRMLYHYIGHDDFRTAVSNYLKKFSYKNAVTNDLWEAFEEASQKPIAKIMSNWTRQTGYPWINVKLETSESSDDMTITLEQEKFTADGEIAAGDENTKWMIPLSIISGSPGVEPIIDLMEDRKKTIVISKQGSQWLKINKDTTGFFRTAYPSTMLERLTKIMVEDLAKKDSDPNYKVNLSSIDRLSLQNDYFALCQAGRVKPGELIKLLSCYQEETEYNVWSSIDNCMFWLSILYRDTDYLDQFRRFGCKLYAKIFSKLTWTPKIDDTHTDSILRSMVISRLVSLGDEAVIKHAKKLYNMQIKEGVPIISDLKKTVYEAIVTHGDDVEFDQLFKIYESEDLLEEKNRVGSTLGYTEDPERMKRVIDLLLSDKVRTQNLVQYILPIGQTSPDVAWKLLKDNKTFFLDKCGSGWMNSRLINATTGYFCRESIIHEISNFFKENRFPSAERTIQQSLERIKLNSVWLERHSLDDQFKQSLTLLG